MRSKLALCIGVLAAILSIQCSAQQASNDSQRLITYLPSLQNKDDNIHSTSSNLSLVTEAFPSLANLTQNPNNASKVGIGGQEFDHCCLVAVYNSLGFDRNGNLVKTNLPGYGISSMVADLNTFRQGPFPCGAKYDGDKSGAPVVQVPYLWCQENCSGWQRSKSSNLNQLVSLFTGFLVPAVVFCLAIPRRRKLWIPEVLFDVPLNKLMPLFRIPFIALAAATLVTLDTVLWLMTIFALTGPILLSGIYEALIDNRVLAYVQIMIKTGRLTTKQRARLLYTMLIGNLDMLTVPPHDEDQNNTAWNHMAYLLRPLDIQGIGRTDGIRKTKTRLRTMLSAQNSFGVTVGAPVVFFGASFVYTLVDNYNNYGDNNTAHAIAFGEYWQTIPHIAIVSGLLGGLSDREFQQIPDMVVARWGHWHTFTLYAYLWYPCVIVSGLLATFAAIGGTMMQIVGVYHDCKCLVPLSQWGWRPERVENVIISDNSYEDIHYAMHYWKGTGADAIAFLGIVAFVGWWYQKRLRYEMKDMIEHIEHEAEGEAAKLVARRQSV